VLPEIGAAFSFTTNVAVKWAAGDFLGFLTLIQSAMDQR
jgi:hypothetical protein